MWEHEEFKCRGSTDTTAHATTGTSKRDAGCIAAYKIQEGFADANYHMHPECTSVMNFYPITELAGDTNMYGWLNRATIPGLQIRTIQDFPWPEGVDSPPSNWTRYATENRLTLLDTTAKQFQTSPLKLEGWEWLFGLTEGDIEGDKYYGNGVFTKRLRPRGAGTGGSGTARDAA
jgi:hypothetical protein